MSFSSVENNNSCWEREREKKKLEEESPGVSRHREMWGIIEHVEVDGSVAAPKKKFSEFKWILKYSKTNRFFFCPRRSTGAQKRHSCARFVFLFIFFWLWDNFRKSPDCPSRKIVLSKWIMIWVGDYARVLAPTKLWWVSFSSKTFTTPV